MTPSEDNPEGRTDGTPARAPARQTGPTITAVLEGGPLAGRHMSVVEGSPPKRLTCAPTTGERVATASRIGSRPVRRARYAALYLV
jgi:hypothetical protein